MTREIGDAVIWQISHSQAFIGTYSLLNLELPKKPSNVARYIGIPISLAIHREELYIETGGRCFPHIRR